MDFTKIHPQLRKAARRLPPLPVHRYWLLRTLRHVVPKVIGEWPVPDGIAARTELDAVKHVGWTNGNNRAAWSWCLGCEAGAGAVPDNAVPARREDLTGLPPTWIGIGDLDLFHEECRVYAERLQQAGVPTEIEEVPEAFHGFESLVPDSELAKGFFDRHFRYARDVLGVEIARI